MGTVSVGMPQRVRRKASRLRSDVQRNRMGAPCLAPYANLYFGPQGDVRACCASASHLGNIRVQRLSEIWGGVQQRELRRRLKEGDYSLGCRYCEWEDERGMGVYARVYDGLKVRSSDPAYPTRLEFALTNSCNLQCLMCDGENSSSIRIHREGRMPSPKAYGDEFFADLAEFIPHLTQASFVGGEPFLGAENFRAWDLFTELNPRAEIGITTNATQWSPRVAGVLEALHPGVTVSIDGMTKATFELIRVGADFDEVLRNVEHFLDHGRRTGKRVNISHCLMPQNYHEFGDLLLYAEERDMHVHVAVVITPASQSLEHMDRADAAAVLASLEEQAARVLPQLGEHNTKCMVGQIDRMRAWMASAGGPELAPEIADAHIVGLTRRVDPRPDDDPAPTPADVFAPLLDRPDRVLKVGKDDIIVDCSDELAAWLDCDRASLIGADLGHLDAALHRRFGQVAGAALGAPGSVDGDVASRTALAGETPVRTVGVAVRDRAGWIIHVEVALGHPTD